jgi:Secretion system C-terminal sorting domain
MVALPGLNRPMAEMVGTDHQFIFSILILDIFAPSIVLKTNNGGSTWVSQLEGFTLNLSDVCFVSPNQGWLLGYTPGRVFHTDNGGLPVELINFSAEEINNNISIKWITATETNNTGFDLERKNNSGNWQTIGFIEGHGTTTETHQYSFTDNDIHPGTYQYRLKQIDYDGSFEYSKVVEVEIPLPNKFSLSQNYPNPFNPVTSMQYTIGNRQLVTLKVYDILGREIATLVNEEKPAGEYEVEFNGTNLPNGIYFYQLNAGEFSETKKMVLIK